MGLIIYVAGPISKGDRTLNLRAAIDVGHRLLQRGHFPFVPHLCESWKLVYDEPYERWMELDFAFIRRCDILVRLPGESAGADREVALAHELGIKVFFGLEAFMADPLWTAEVIPKKTTQEMIDDHTRRFLRTPFPQLKKDY